MKPFWLGAAIGFSFFIANFQADAASVLYNTTDIGSNFQILAGSGGQYYGVVGSTGVTYAFDKAPVSLINIDTPNFNDSSQTILRIQSGSYQVGYTLATGDFGHFLHRVIQKSSGGDLEAL